MTLTENKELFHRYQDALRHPEKLESVLAPDFVAYDLPQGQRSLAHLKRFREFVNRMATDQSVTVDYLVAEDDLVAAHITATQTLPNGKRLSFSGVEIVSIQGHKIAWRRGMLDDAGHALKRRGRSLPGRLMGLAFRLQAARASKRASSRAK